jgi:hypothetical protein
MAAISALLIFIFINLLIAFRFCGLLIDFNALVYIYLNFGILIGLAGLRTCLNFTPKQVFDNMVYGSGAIPWQTPNLFPLVV